MGAMAFQRKYSQLAPKTIWPRTNSRLNEGRTGKCQADTDSWRNDSAVSMTLGHQWQIIPLPRTSWLICCRCCGRAKPKPKFTGGEIACLPFPRAFSPRITNVFQIYGSISRVINRPWATFQALPIKECKNHSTTLSESLPGVKRLSCTQLLTSH